MRPVEDLELGLMFWATASPEESIAFVRQFGLRAGQLGFGGDLDLDQAARLWPAALESNPNLSISTAVCSYSGEDYANFAAVLETVGLVPAATRAERIARTKQVSDVAAKLGIQSVACHVGFIPEDHASDDYLEMRNVVRDLCHHMRGHHQNFTLETGQEPAKALLAFIEAVGRPNLKINFDPANMILYGTGDPVEALRLLAPHVISVHCKDGDWPSRDKPGALGEERRLGDGAVDFPAFISTLKANHYQGLLTIEREELDARKRSTDIRHAVSFLRGIVSPTNISNES